jgi:cytochrome c-type biogenesis protein CcmH
VWYFPRIAGNLQNHYQLTMVFWIICAGMTFAAVAAMLFPFLRTERTISDASDIEVYKDQLIEIDSDEKRALISPTEAATARVEVSRRILKADDAAKHKINKTHTPLSRAVLVIATLSVPIVSWGTYSKIGAPNEADQPIASRLNVPAADASMEVLVAKAEAHLKANPADGRGWAVLAPIYLRLARFEDAIKAFEMASKLVGPSAIYEIGIGQAWTGINGGRANDNARAAYVRASKLDPDNIEPKLLLATDLAQQGKFAEAKLSFQSLLAIAPPSAPWRPLLEDMIARVDQAIATGQLAKAPGPSQADVENAAGMAPADRLTMIEGMVAQLDTKLKQNPSDKDGWKRLIRSYTVLKKPEKVLETVQRARSGLKDDKSALAEIDALVGELGIARQ